jgi:hypothetical protein
MLLKFVKKKIIKFRSYIPSKFCPKFTDLNKKKIKRMLVTFVKKKIKKNFEDIYLRNSVQIHGPNKKKRMLVTFVKKKIKTKNFEYLRSSIQKPPGKSRTCKKNTIETLVNVSLKKIKIKTELRRIPSKFYPEVTRDPRTCKRK